MPKEKPTRTTLYLEASLWKQIKIEAAKRSLTATAIVDTALRHWLTNARKGGR